MVKNIFVSDNLEARKEAFNRKWREYIEQMENKKSS